MNRPKIRGDIEEKSGNARKAQGQFSWDWAPHLPSLGIYRKVKIQAIQPGVIEDVYIRSQTNGKVHMLIELDEACKNLLLAHQDLELAIEISQGKKSIKRKIPVRGVRNIANFLMPNPQLWWPNGYGQARSAQVFSAPVLFFSDRFS